MILGYHYRRNSQQSTTPASALEVLFDPPPSYNWPVSQRDRRAMMRIQMDQIWRSWTNQCRKIKEIWSLQGVQNQAKQGSFECLWLEIVSLRHMDLRHFVFDAVSLPHNTWSFHAATAFQRRITAILYLNETCSHWAKLFQLSELPDPTELVSIQVNVESPVVVTHLQRHHSGIAS